METHNCNLKNVPRFLEFPLNLTLLARRRANSFRHVNNRLEHICISIVLSQEKSESICLLNGVQTKDFHTPLMRVTYPGMLAHHINFSLRNEIFFWYKPEDMNLFKSFGFHNCDFTFTDRFSSILEDIEKLLENYRKPGVADRLDRLAIMLATEAMISSLEPDLEKKLDIHVDERIFMIENYFRFHYTEEIDLTALLKSYSMTPRTFYREWKKYFIMSPLKYIISLKLTEACRLLTTSRLKVYEIAEQCGFLSVIYFSRVFTEKIGLSPEAYRRKKLIEEKL